MGDGALILLGCLGHWNTKMASVTEFEMRVAHRVGRVRRRGLSGLGLLLVAAGLLALAVQFWALPPLALRLWPLALVAVGLVGLLRRPGWVEELDWQLGPRISRALDRPRRLFSLLLIGLGALFLPFTTGLVDSRVIGPGLLVALGLLLIWRRSR